MKVNGHILCLTSYFLLFKRYSLIYQVARLQAKILMSKNQVSSNRIVFELTETAVVEHIKSAILVMNEIRTLGCKFALDDFGTGFSSLSHLKQLPADIIKIDGAFGKGSAI